MKQPPQKKSTDLDKALAKPGTVTPTEKIHTDEPLAEKDEVKEAEEKQKKTIKKK